jgi:hypothetical protein
MNKPTPPGDVRPLDLRVRNGEITWEHIRAEYVDIVDDIIETLAPEGPYAYTVTAALADDGSIPEQKIMLTREQIRGAYQDMHRVSLVTGMEPAIEIRTDWYVFLYGMGAGLDKTVNQPSQHPVAIVFPTMGQSGITGEPFWRRTGVGDPYTGGRTGALAARPPSWPCTRSSWTTCATPTWTPSSPCSIRAPRLRSATTCATPAR